MAEGTAEERQPIAEVLQGLEIHPLEPGWTAIEALVLMKCLDEEGHVSWAYRTTHRLNREELLGALVVHTDVLRRELADEWIDDDSDRP
ncbi:MAG: hypothetical protein AB1679_02705 [Actinomycetota bacterium]